MEKKLIKHLMVGFIVLALAGTIIVFLAHSIEHKITSEIKENYSKPDTTIVIKNGKADTVITKKSIPSWLK